MTSPSCPVRVRRSGRPSRSRPRSGFLPLRLSMPGLSQNRPSLFVRRRLRNRVRRDNVSTFPRSIVRLAAFFFPFVLLYNFLFAVFLHSVAISRSRFRTPASRVYSLNNLVDRTIRDDDIALREPVSCSCRGIICRRAISLLSCWRYPGNSDDLHPILQRKRDLVPHIRRG